MSAFRSLFMTGVLAVASAFPSIAVAADVSALQTALSIARDNLEKEKTRQAAGRQALVQQKKIVDARRKELAVETGKLDKLKNEVQQEDKQYLEAKQKYDKAQANLDAAWGN